MRQKSPLVFANVVLALIISAFIYGCNNSSEQKTASIEERDLPRADPLSEYDTFYIPIDSFNQLKPVVTDNFYILAQRSAAGLGANYKAIAAPGLFADLFVSGLASCGIPITSNSVLTQYFNIRLGDVYNIETLRRGKGRQLKEKVIAMQNIIKSEWISKHQISVSQCGGLLNPQKNDSAIVKAFKVKVESLIKDYSLSKVDMKDVIIEEVQTAYIKQFITKNPEDLIAVSATDRDNYVAVRTVTIPELTFTFISKRGKVQSADAGNALAFLDINTAYFERERTSNDSLVLKFKNITAICDFKGFGKDEKPNRKR